VACGFAALALLASPARAQDDLPPVAAPTSSIDVGGLPLVRSDSQVATDYARGLMDALVAREGIRAAAMVLVSQDRVDMAEGFGAADTNTPFALGTMSDVFGVVSVLQLVEQARLLLADDLGPMLGEAEPLGFTLADLLTHRPDEESELLANVVTRSSGMPYRMYISQRVLTPLGMRDSRYEEDDRLLVSPGDMGQFLLALVNDGAPSAATGEGRILLPATAQLMQRTHYTVHPALPGWSYGFGEMYRNGWRALQRDGERETEPLAQSRIVVIPESRIAYFIAVEGEATPEFWRTLDDFLFDHVAPPRAPAADLRAGVDAPGTPGEAEATDLAGLYVVSEGRDPAIFLKVGRAPLTVAAEGATLRLSGAIDTVLEPAPGGVWRAQGNFIPAALVEGSFRVGNDVFLPQPLWQRPLAILIAAGLLVLVVFMTFATRVYHRRKVA
jgi:hypothetical protein